jgi:hypothetical protein
MTSDKNSKPYWLVFYVLAMYLAFLTFCIPPFRLFAFRLAFTTRTIRSLSRAQSALTRAHNHIMARTATTYQGRCSSSNLPAASRAPEANVHRENGGDDDATKTTTRRHKRHRHQPQGIPTEIFAANMNGNMTGSVVAVSICMLCMCACISCLVSAILLSGLHLCGSRPLSKTIS